ncbi:M48 family metallopeptidase [Rhodoferax sp. 4810]|uniref:Putative beta-barrel assembly-enhancing protease n=1 Tax=Thiospirillum jenense TaxID=1653858 RepID=A0A839HE51_9GAMM|nr:M48 family metalloprotease [Thiospirillum jenense]MBB1075836.1 M48 family metallopeptidase [Rhodoferax jenense]MBB1126911.1 M48 family metallopeptidase [Thiospirillum jenense]
MNSGRFHFKTLALTLIISGQIGIAPADLYQLPDFGSSVDTLLSAAEQRELDRAFMQSVRQSLPISSDPIVGDYLQQLGQSLTTAGTIKHYDFFLIDQRVINAFAGPGGHIGVFAGLILAAETEDELAAVLAHEIAHVEQKHLLRAFESQQQNAIPMTALLIAAVVLGAQVDANMGAAAMTGIQAAALQKQINFTRDHEKEADRLGITILAQAGYDPYAMPGFFERLTKANQFYENGAPELLRTHPVTTNRIADALARAEHFGHHQRSENVSFHLIKARLRQQRYARAQEAVEHFNQTLTTGRYRNATAEHYGYALALTRDGQFAAARREVAKLLADNPNQVELIVLNAELDRHTGSLTKALRDLKTAVANAPRSWALADAYAAMQMAANQPAAALITLERFNRLRPDITAVYGLMADAAGRAGKRLQTYRYRAEQLYHQGDIKLAVNQLELALKQPTITPYLAERLQARLKELKELADEQRQQQSPRRR